MTPNDHTPSTADQRLIAQADVLLARFDALLPADYVMRQYLAQERGWVSAVRSLAARGGLSHAGHVYAGGMLAESGEWVRKLTGEEAGHER